MSTRVVIKESKHYPHGIFGMPRGAVTEGYPPSINPAVGGELFIPEGSENYGIYPALAYKLARAMLAAVPEGTGPILDIQLRSPNHDVLAAYYNLLCDAFVLGEVDPGHSLLKIATLTDFDEFRAAVDALDA